MNLYDKSSLILVPGAVKQGKVYSQRPENGDGDFTFTRASTATRVNENGLIENVSSNTPRLDYSGGASCPSLLLEPQRTNYVPYSEQLDSNSKSGGTYIPNAEISPDGTRNAYGIDQDSSGDRVQPNIGVYDGLVTLSMYIKPVATIRPRLNVYNSVNGSVYGALFQWDGTDFTITSDGEGYTDVGYENAGNGWYRLWVVGTSISGGNTLGQFRPNTDVDISNRLYFWGLQAERGSYPTSYIPTSGTSVTRNADFFSIQDLQSKGIFGASAGTIFLDIKSAKSEDNNEIVWQWSDSLSNPLLRLYYREEGQCSIFRFYNNLDAEFLTDNVDLTNTPKIAISYDGTSRLELFGNGTKLTKTGGNFNSNAIIDIFSEVAADRNSTEFNRILFFPTALSDADCIALTQL